MNELMETGTGPALPPIGDSYDTPTPKEDTSFLDRLQEETKDFLDKKHPALGPAQDAIEMFTPIGAAAEVKSAGDSLVQASDEASSGEFREALSSLVESATAGLSAFAPGPTSEQLQTLLGVFAGPMAKRYNKEAAEQLQSKAKELQERGAKGEITPEEEESEIRLLLQDHYDEHAQFYSPNPNNGIQQEVFDGNSKLNPTFFNENALNRGWTYNLSGVLDHPDLFDNYPDFKYLPVSATIAREGFSGAANSPTSNEPLGSIDLTVPSYRAFKFRYFENKNVDEEIIKALYNDRIRGVLLHEVQHHIQRLEGFDRGSNPVSFVKAPFSSQEPYLKLHLSSALGRFFDVPLEGSDLDDFLTVVAEASLESKTLGDFIDDQPVHRLPYLFKNLMDVARFNNMSLGQISDHFYRTSFDKARYDWYTDKFGEVEARAVQERINYTSPDDSLEFPNESFDSPVIHYRTDKRQFNKGGLVPNMEDQTLEAFGEPEDPVSGNPVPPGGTPEGVRDDIDAKLSEGEYVLPAHVVRFIGVGKLEQLVQAVEQQLQKMEQGGRMGEPVQEPAASQDMDEELPFDPNELEAEEAPTGPMGFNQGGLVQDRVGNAPTVPNAPQTSVRLYRDRTGFIRAVPFVNGQAIGLVPEGAQEIPSGASPTGSNFQPTQQAQQSNQAGMGVSEFERNEKDNVSYDISSLSGQEARDMLRGQNQIVDFLDSPYGTAAKAVTGPFGRFAAAAQQPIQQALADQVLTQEYGEESQGLLGALLGGTKVGNVLGFDNRVQSLQDQDLVKEIRSNYTPPSSTRERVDTPTISRTTPSGRTVSSPVPTSRPDGLGGSSKSAPDSRDFGGDGGWSDAGQSVDNSRSSQGGFDGPGGLW